MRPRTPIITPRIGPPPTRMQPTPIAPRLAVPTKKPITPPPFIRVDAENQRAQVRPSTKRADYEGGWQRIILPTNGRTNVFSTTRRWRGVDVFLARPAFEADIVSPLIRLSVFAYIEGMDRVLVATGIYRHNSAPGLPVTPSSWLCAARVAADRFDIELSLNGTPLDPGVDAVDVGIIATDELVEAPRDLGAVPMLDTAVLLDSTARAPTPVVGDPGYEVVAVQATMAAGAAPRWLHLHNINSVNPLDLNGQAPRFAFGMPAIGHSAYSDEEWLRTIRFDTGLAACSSSTGYTTTIAAVGDVAYQVWFR